MNPLFQKFLAQHRMEYLTLDEDLIILETSVGVQRFADAPEEVDLGKDVREGFPEIFGMEDALIAVMSGQESSMELKGLGRFSNPKYPLYFDIYAMENIDDRSPGRLIIFFEDVTETMDMKQKLVQRSNRTNLLLNQLKSTLTYIDKVVNSIADALLVTNPLGQIKRANEAAEKMFGYSERDLIEEPISLIIEDPVFLKRVSISEKKEFKNAKVICRKKTGEKITVDFSFAIFKDEIEETYNCIYIGRDISSDRQMESELQEVKEKLSKTMERLEERNMEIALLSKLNSVLPSCLTLEEAYAAIAEKLQSLFGDLVGGIFALESSSQVVPAFATWGHPSLESQKQFSTNACSALEKFQANSSGAQLSDLLCEHLHRDFAPAEYCCLPTIVRQETVGLLYLSSFKKGQLSKDRQRLAVMVAEQIGIALVSLKQQ